MADYFWKSVDAFCPDRKFRKVRVRHYCYNAAMAADTFFSVPARVTIGKRTITGFVNWADPDYYGVRYLQFYPHTRHEPITYPGKA